MNKYKEIVSNIVLGCTSAILLVWASYAFGHLVDHETFSIHTPLYEVLASLVPLGYLIGPVALIYSLVAVKKSQAATLWLRLLFGLSLLLLITAMALGYIETIRLMRNFK